MSAVFVSGSLVKGGRYHQHYLQGQKFLGAGFIEGYASYILGGLDGIVPREGKRVQGEVYEVDARGLHRLDFFHENETHFNRSPVEVRLEDGQSLPAEVYIWKGSVK